MKNVLAALAVAATCFGAAPQAQAAQYELKLSSMFPSTHFIQKLALEPWAKEVEQKTGGKVHITIFSAGSAFGNASRQFDQVRAGVVDFAVGIPAIPRGRHPRIVLSELPFVLPDAEVGTCALMRMKSEFQPDFPGTHILSLTVTEPSSVHTTKEIKTLDDLKGMRIRTPTPAITAMLKLIGATPVGMPPTQIYESVERGVVDGNVMPWGPVGAFKLYEVLPYHLDARINPVSMYILMNQHRYDTLPKDIQQAIDSASADVFSHWGKWWAETDQQAIDAAKAKGNTIIPMSDAARADWRKRLQPMIANYLAKDSDLGAAEATKIYDDIGAAVQACE